ncbi:hypothetical protein [Candidatus Carsonella ruddii]|uniref:3-phosphoshikimate 1-carboxyvinyltransferase n=1 Tax=Candidatus Carsonella ruddii (Diaphorina cf. continua) TaxID=2661587 RepID=A0A7R6VY91_CARRU|nr:hypothetical protein [Candidatus Carsonella ruddii (Diaphorina cf. continua)]BCG49277.1 3-phosphoshikimate 1-carboxyvinyltransferase [Candidatus Carsonella ruddii (Diaphorina cf. continua)]
MKSYFKINCIKIKKKKIKVGDKSLSHRSIIYCLIKNCIIEISNILESLDILSTINLCKNIGIYMYGPINSYLLASSLKKKNMKNKISYIGNSGTTIRITLSLLIKNNFVIGDKSLNKRTMYRIIKPLTLIGYVLQCKKNFFTPIIIIKKNNFGLKYNLVNSSSQIKSCLLLSSLNSFFKIFLKEKKKTRDHTERFFPILKKKIKNFNIKIPNDFSSISFIISYNLINKNNFILNLGFNKLRNGFFEYLLNSNLKIFFIKKKIYKNEHFAKILFFKFFIKKNTIFSENISKMIDEIPILLLLLIKLKNKNKIYGLEELKFKESNRFLSMYYNIIFLGVKIIKKKNYLIFKSKNIHNNYVKSLSDHRLFMSFYIGNVYNVKISNPENILSSFPSFFNLFNNKKNNYYVYK